MTRWKREESDPEVVFWSKRTRDPWSLMTVRRSCRGVWFWVYNTTNVTAEGQESTEAKAKKMCDFVAFLLRAI